MKALPGWPNSVVLGCALSLTSVASTSTAARGAGFVVPRTWECSAPLIAPEARGNHTSRAQKDPSVVFHDGLWHVFMTVKLPGRSAIEHCSFENWEEAQAAPRTILTVSDSDYYCAPQVFYFRPHQRWYLVYQMAMPGVDKMWVAHSTTSDIADPGSWTRAQPILDGGKDDPREVGGLDYWIICDAERAYLFLTSLDGRMWRLWTHLADFPRGFGHCELALEAKIFEASHTYKLKGMDRYLTLIEENGRRYYKAYTADRLDGEWVPVADTPERPFAGWTNVGPAPGVEPWTDNISHGELIREGSDETLTVDPHDLRFVFQGMWDKDKSGIGYGQFQWRIGMLTPREVPAAYQDRFVWVFGWGLGRDTDVVEISRLLETAASHGINGAVVSFGLDTLCKKSPDYFRRLDEVKQACERNRIELIPAVFSVGYGGAALAHDRNLAEGVPVEDALLAVQGSEARWVPEATAQLVNGGFEEFDGNRLKGFRFHDQPGEVSFIDTQVKHGGEASLRLENFTANPHGHGRVMQELSVRPHRTYRVSLWVKTEALDPVSGFQLTVLAGNRSLAPRTFKLTATGDWQKLTMLFNSLEFDSVRLYAGLWGGKGGRLWLDDWAIEEAGPLNVLRRPGTPVSVRSEDGSTTYREGTDYAPLVDPDYSPYRVDRAAPSLQLLPDSRIRDNERLRVSWYHTLVVHDSQITVCMAEPALYEIFDHEAQLLAERLHPRRVMLNMDEVRMGGTCRACCGRDMGELLGECITRQAQSLRKYSPGVELYVWSDMLDPNHNARGDYYLVDGDFTGSWKHVPRNLTIAVWGGEPRESSLRFFAEHGFPILVACYYDAGDLGDVKRWFNLARDTRNVRGFMYTPWQKKYALLPAFGDLFRE